MGDLYRYGNSSAELGYFDHKRKSFIWDKNSKQEFAQNTSIWVWNYTFYI